MKIVPPANPPTPVYRKAALLAGFAATGVFLALASMELALPGLNMDEACIDSYVVKVLDPSKIDRFTYNLPDNVFDTGLRFPLVADIYVGLIGMYASVPYYYLFGLSIYSLRIYHALYGAMTVLLVFFILQRLLGKRFAAVGAFLLAIDSALLLAYRSQGWNVIAPMPILLLAMLLALPKEAEMKPVSPRRALLIGILYGLACYGYFVYVLLGPPMALALMLVARKHINLKSMAAGLVGCTLGYTPLLYALASIAYRAPVLLSGFVQRTGSTLGFAARCQHLLRAIRRTLDDCGYSQQMAGIFDVPFPWAKSMFWIVLALAIPTTLYFFSARTRARSLLVFCAIVVVGYWLELLKFGGQIAGHHVLVAFPFLYMMLAAAMEVITGGVHDRMARRKISSGIQDSPATRLASWTPRATWCGMGAIVVMFVIVNVTQHVAMIRQLRVTGGTGNWSNAINALAADLEMYHLDDAVIYCDWGYMLPCHVLSRGHIASKPDIGANAQQMQKKFDGLFQQHPRLTFVLSKTPLTTVTRQPNAMIRRLVLETAQRHGYRNESEKTFYQRDGQPVIETITLAKDSRQSDSKEGDPHHAETRHGRNRALLASRTPWDGNCGTGALLQRGTDDRASDRGLSCRTPRGHDLRLRQ